jgi:hypothetical protein
MESKILAGIPIKSYTDEILKITFIKLITQENCVEIKLPTNIENYKYSYLINPCNLLTCELIKTKKNWILKQIIETQTLCKPQNFAEFMQISEIQKKLKERLWEGQEIEILDFIKNFFLDKNWADLGVQNFERALDKRLGFA